jgi:5-deoxy-glucuronate isomerase
MMTSQKLLYRSARVPQGRTAAALNLTPRALGWDRIHFAVRHLAKGAAWVGSARNEERCLVLLRGEFEVRWAGASHRIGPRADVFSGYPHAVYLPARTPFRIVARAAWRDRRCASRVEEGARPAGDPAGRLRLRNSRRRQCHPPDRRRDVARVSRRSPAGVRGVHPGRQLVFYPPHKRRRRPPREADLEEVYYCFRFREANGYGFHRVYNHRRDDTLRVTHGDVVAVRDGFHPFVTALWLRCLLPERARR